MVMISLSCRCASLRFLTGPTRSSTIQNRRMMISSVGMLSSCGYDTCFSTTYRTTGGGMCVYNTWFICSRWADPLGLATMVTIAYSTMINAPGLLQGRARHDSLSCLGVLFYDTVLFLTGFTAHGICPYVAATLRADILP